MIGTTASNQAALHLASWVAMALATVASAGLNGCDSDDTGKDESASRAAPAGEQPGQAPSEPEAANETTASLDADALGEIFETDAKVTKDGVVRVTWPRSEVPVSIDGLGFPPSAGLTSWVGFAPAADGAMVMGDTVVFQDEVSPAMDAAFAHGLEITALHNHFFFDEPKVYFMHIGGRGDARELARGARAVWDAIRERRREQPEVASTFGGDVPEAGGDIDAAAIGKIVGTKPSVKKGGVVKVAVPRKATMGGIEFGGSMGLASWAAFTGNDELAAIDGDFAMTAAEVQPVLRALRAADIHVVALHNHMLDEKPAYYFTHFWGKGRATELARGFRAALDAQREASADDAP